MNSIVTKRFIQCHNKLKEDKRIKSSRQFALSLDYLPQSLSEMLRGRRDVTIELLRKSIETYKLNPVYLFTGSGPLFLEEEHHNSLRVLTIVKDGENDEKIVYVPIPAQAGYVKEFGNASFVKELPVFTLPDFKYQVGTHRCFEVGGDHMEPTLFEGDKVVCSYLEPAHWISSIKDNYVYVVITRGDVLIKRVRNLLREEKLLELRSDNHFYKPMQLAMKDIVEVWYVRLKVSPFLPAPQHIQELIREELQELRRSVNEQRDLLKELQSNQQRP